MAKTNKIVFICRRNRFRSQIAKGLYNKSASKNCVAEAYGVSVISEEEGILFSKHPRVVHTIVAMKNHGIDISNESCHQLKPEHLKDVSKIIVLTDKNDLPDWLKGYNYELWETKDYPGIPTLEQAEETISLIQKKILLLSS